MKSKFKPFLFSVICLVTFGLQVQAQQPLALSLDSAVTYAVSHNRSLINSKFAVDKTSQKVKETIALGLPQISATIDYTNFLGAEASLMGKTIEFNPTSNFKATATQLIFSGSYIVGIQLSKLAKTVTEQSYQKDEINVKEQVIQAYYMVLASERILENLRANKANVQLIYEKTQNLANAGMIEPTDAKKLSIMVTTVDNAIKSSERQVEMGYNLLRLQLGLEPNSEIQLSTSLDDIVQNRITQSVAADTFNLQNNLDYKMILMQGEIAKKNIALRKVSYLPTLAAFYSYTEKLKKPEFDMTPKNAVGFTLSIPILSGGQRWAQLNQAKLDYRTSENTKELVSQQLLIQERQLRFNYSNLYEQYLNQKANLEIVKEVLEKMNLKYQQGVVSSLEFTSSNNDYMTAESNYIGVMLQLLNAELSLRKINNNL
jgi:outer membrane protein TolC